MKSYLFLFMGILLLYWHTCYGQSSTDIQSYITQYKEIALEQEQQYGIPASITLAQGILESGAGKSSLTHNTNNHFGIKAFADWTGPVYLAWDDEQQKSRFRKYPSAIDSFKDHSMFLKKNNRYRNLFSISVYDYRAWAIGLQKAGYATADNYAKALIGFIDAYKLYTLNGGVKLKAGKTVTITTIITPSTPTFDTEYIMNETEESEEEKLVKNVIKRFVVEINGVRCTILYPGETLSSIAQRYDIPQYKILEFNEIANHDNLKEGDIVFLQKKKSRYTGIQDYYQVKKDETIYEISQRFGIKMASLARMNNKDFFSILQEGEKLRLK